MLGSSVMQTQSRHRGLNSVGNAAERHGVWGSRRCINLRNYQKRPLASPRWQVPHSRAVSGEAACEHEFGRASRAREHVRPHPAVTHGGTNRCSEWRERFSSISWGAVQRNFASCSSLALSGLCPSGLILNRSIPGFPRSKISRDTSERRGSRLLEKVTPYSFSGRGPT